MKLGTQDKELYHHAKDNAVSSLGKVLKYQPNSITDQDQVFTDWLQNLPIEKDVEEAKIMNEFLADALIANFQYVFGPKNERVGQVIKVLSL